MPIPIPPETIEDEKLLRELLITPGFTQGYYDSVRDRLLEVEKMHDAIRHLTEERAKARKKVEPVKPKKRGQLDKKSVEHTVTNSLLAGGVAGPVFLGKEVLGIYDDLKSRGIAPSEEAIIGTIKSQGFSDATIVYFWTAVILVGLATVIWKLSQEYK